MSHQHAQEKKHIFDNENDTSLLEILRSQKYSNVLKNIYSQAAKIPGNALPHKLRL